MQIFPLPHLALFVQGKNSMARKTLIREEFFPYHITNRTREKLFYQLPLEKVWNIYADQFRIATWVYGAKIHSFVLMSNHYHLLLSTPDGNVDNIVRFFQSEVSKEITALTESKKNAFDTRYRWSLIYEKNHFYNVYRYIYQNPIRANISRQVSDYKYSTFHGRAGYSKLEIPISHHPFFEEDSFSTYREEENWLNELLDEEQLGLIRKGVRRFEFSVSNRNRYKLDRYR